MRSNGDRQAETNNAGLTKHEARNGSGGRDNTLPEIRSNIGAELYRVPHLILLRPGPYGPVCHITRVM